MAALAAFEREKKKTAAQEELKVQNFRNCSIFRTDLKIQEVMRKLVGSLKKPVTLWGIMF